MSVYRTSRRAHVQSSRKVTLYLGCVRVRIGLGGLRWSLLPLAKSNANILSQYSLYQEFDFAAAFRLALRNQTRPSVVSVQFVPGMYSISHYRGLISPCTSKCQYSYMVYFSNPRAQLNMHLFVRVLAPLSTRSSTRSELLFYTVLCASSLVPTCTGSGQATPPFLV